MISFNFQFKYLTIIKDCVESPGEFKCNVDNKEKCFRKFKKCDTVEDCDDKSDEKNCRGINRIRTPH